MKCEKNIFERPSDAYVSTVKIFISIEVALQELGGGFAQPTPLGQGVGKKHIGRERVKAVRHQFNWLLRIMGMDYLHKTYLLTKMIISQLSINYQILHKDPCMENLNGIRTIQSI